MNGLEKMCPAVLAVPASEGTRADLAEIWRLTKISQRKTRARRDLPQVRTRSSYDRFQHNTVELPGLEGDAAFVPVGQSGQWDIIPRIREKRSLQYDVYTIPNSSVFIKKTGKWRRQEFHKGGFKKCCPDGCKSGRGCQRKFCAGCYCSDHAPPRGRRWLILENFDPNRSIVIDPHGVHETGRKSGGKALHKKDIDGVKSRPPKRPDDDRGWYKHKHKRW